MTTVASETLEGMFFLDVLSMGTLVWKESQILSINDDEIL